MIGWLKDGLTYGLNNKGLSEDSKDLQKKGKCPKGSSVEFLKYMVDFLE